MGVGESKWGTGWRPGKGSRMQNLVGPEPSEGPGGGTSEGFQVTGLGRWGRPANPDR